MRHGEVWTVTVPGFTHQWRVAVVSGDGYNEVPGARPYVVPIVRRTGGDLPAFVAALADPDPVGGIALVGGMTQISPRFATQQVGILTGASLARIGGVIRDLFEL